MEERERRTGRIFVQLGNDITWVPGPTMWVLGESVESTVSLETHG